MSEPYISVVTEEHIACGTLIGPLPLSSGSPDSLAVLTWRCVDKLTTSKQVIKVTLTDPLNSKPKSWLSHVLPARNPEEQTLEIVVKSGQLYFRSLRDIEAEEELRAWFGEDLAEILKLPMIPPNVIEGEKRFECMICQEQFENPFPVVAHLMYRCRRKEHETTGMNNTFRKKNSGRVKNFNIATLTDMNDSRENVSDDPPSPTISVTSETDKMSSDKTPETSPKRKKSIEILNDSSHLQKKRRTERDCFKTSSKTVDAPRNTPENSLSGAFKPATSTTTLTYHSQSDHNPLENNGSSAFKKVDKSSTAFHSNITSLSTLFPGGLDPREFLFQTGPNSFSHFPYGMTPVTTSAPYGGANLPQNLSPTSHPGLTLPSMESHMTSAFVPKLATSVTNSGMHQQLKMAEDLKLLRKLPGLHQENGYDIGPLMSPPINSSRMNGVAPGLQYNSKTQMDVFGGGGAKSLPSAPLLPFLPPSLAALTFPSQNWCAKCNASFRMTSDLVYHMRSHHKRETDPQKLKREEKLKCHICNETFRERHHLTRHMTSHQ